MLLSLGLPRYPFKSFVTGFEGVIVGDLVTLYACCGADLPNIKELSHPAIAVRNALPLNVESPVLFNVHDCLPWSACLAGEVPGEQAGVVFDFAPLQGTGAWSVVRKSFDLTDVFLNGERPGVQ
jgi:hypothetical protein